MAGERLGKERPSFKLVMEGAAVGLTPIFDDGEKPSLMTTTFWDYPRQSYGKRPKGNNKYPGVTPAFIIWNLVQRYTHPGDLVVDPMAGSGTTVDVCDEEGRFVIGFDIVPAHPKVFPADARAIPLRDNVADLVFVDSPYSDNEYYNDHPANIGRISCEDERFFDELEKVARECYRILKPGKILAWLIGDQWVQKRFTPVGFLLFQRLCQFFEPVDIVCVARRNQTSNTRVWHYRAARFNFYLRGFKYLFIMQKPDPNRPKPVRHRINWSFYERQPSRAWEGEKAFSSSEGNHSANQPLQPRLILGDEKEGEFCSGSRM